MMYPLGGNPNQLVLQCSEGDDFSTSMPARLLGIITPQEYTASITRINDAKRPGWARWLGVLCTVAGIVLWIVVLATTVGTFGAGFGGIFGGFAAMVALVILGAGIGVMERRRRVACAQAVVTEEHARYTAPERATPVSWVLTTDTTFWGRRQRSLLMTLLIEVGGAAALQFPVAVGAVPYAMPYGAAQSPPYGMAGQQPGYGMPGQPQYGAPVYNGAAGMAHPYAQPAPPQHFPQPQPQPASTGEGQPAEGGGNYAVGTDHPRSPLLGSPGVAVAYGGAAPVVSAPGGAAVEGSASPASCERCGRAAVTAQDRFCSACGGSIRRAWA